MKSRDGFIMLDERSSKIRKKEPTYTRDAEMTQKVYEKIDKMAVESITGKGKGFVRKSLVISPEKPTQEELAIAELPHEIAIRYSNQGQIMKVIKGSKSNVTVPKTETGDTVTHNHPGGLGPSDTDLMIALVSKMTEMRIITKQGSRPTLYRLIAKGELDKKKAAEVVSYYLEVMINDKGRVINTVKARDNALELTLDKFKSIFRSEKHIF